MERLNEKYNLDCFSSSELDSESDDQMRESNTAMNMVMRHSNKRKERKDICKFLRLIFAETSFLKTDLPITSSRYRSTKIPTLSVIVNQHIVYACTCI